MAKTHRWTVKLRYKCSFWGGMRNRTEEFGIEELEELQNIVEYGPDFNLIEKIVITYNLRKE